jgi:hypothetical protein
MLHTIYYIDHWGSSQFACLVLHATPLPMQDRLHGRILEERAILGKNCAIANRMLRIAKRRFALIRVRKQQRWRARSPDVPVFCYTRTLIR